MALYHHARHLAEVYFGVVRPNPALADQDYIKAYLWLEKQVGYFPLFLAVGDHPLDYNNTGYQDQWRRWLGTDSETASRIYRKKNEAPNQVLFTFEEVAGGHFQDFDLWIAILNYTSGDLPIPKNIPPQVLKPSWNKARWLKKAHRNPGSINYTMPELDLRRAVRVWVRNRKTKRELETMGFRNVIVHRIPVDPTT